MPTTRSPVRNVWSASMAFRREGFMAVGGFRVGFGKVGDRSRPEDTDLCLRISQETGGHWVYVPDAVIDHPVPADKATLRYFVTRTYNEGRGKVEMARLNPGRQETLESERLYLRRTLPRAIGRGLADPFRGKVSGLARAAAVVTGLGSAGVGGAVETVRGRRAPQPPAVAKVVE
jgi:GT2 family glycosyltransferase